VVTCKLTPLSDIDTDVTNQERDPADLPCQALSWDPHHWDSCVELLGTDPDVFRADRTEKDRGRSLMVSDMQRILWPLRSFDLAAPLDRDKRPVNRLVAPTKRATTMTAGIDVLGYRSA